MKKLSIITGVVLLLITCVIGGYQAGAAFRLGPTTDLKADRLDVKGRWI